MDIKWKQNKKWNQNKNDIKKIQSKWNQNENENELKIKRKWIKML